MGKMDHKGQGKRFQARTINDPGVNKWPFRNSMDQALSSWSSLQWIEIGRLCAWKAALHLWTFNAGATSFVGTVLAAVSLDSWSVKRVTFSWDRGQHHRSCFFLWSFSLCSPINIPLGNILHILPIFFTVARTQISLNTHYKTIKSIEICKSLSPFLCCFALSCVSLFPSVSPASRHQMPTWSFVPVIHLPSHIFDFY